MKIELPLETWTDVFGFVPRSQLKQLVPHIGDETHECDSRGHRHILSSVAKFLFSQKRDHQQGRKCQQPTTIGDRKFVSFVQFFLHKFGQITLGRLYIYGYEPIVIVNCNGKNRSLADVPIPENVKNFKSITITNCRESIFAFLQEFQRNSLFDNVNLYFQQNYPNFTLQTMNNFLQLFTNINSVEINSDDANVLDLLQNECTELANPMFTSARFLVAGYNCRDSWFCDWLHTPREDGKPRALILRGYPKDRAYSHISFIKHIKKDFLEANQQQAVSFFIKLENFRDAASVQPLTLENGQTQEVLAIKGKTQDHDYLSISRYSLGTNEKEWIEEMSQHPKIDNRIIKFVQ